MLPNSLGWHDCCCDVLYYVLPLYRYNLEVPKKQRDGGSYDLFVQWFQVSDFRDSFVSQDSNIECHNVKRACSAKMENKDDNGHINLGFGLYCA
jgi:hypothetical protein